MSFQTIFEANKGVSKAKNTVLTLNQQVTDSIPVRLTIFKIISTHFFVVLLLILQFAKQFA